MAKKKARPEAKQAKKKPGKPARKGPTNKPRKKTRAKKLVSRAAGVEAAAESQSPKASNEDVSRNWELQEGALATRVAALVMQELAALGYVLQRLPTSENALVDSIQAPVAPGDSPAPEPERVAGAAERAALAARRQELWRAELNQQKPLRLPRPMILGRAVLVLELEQQGDHGTPPARQVFKRIQTNGAHHLSQTIVRLVARRGSGSGSALRKQFKTRCERLRNALVMEKAGSTYRLTPRGRKVFDGWPEWGVADSDNSCEGFMTSAASVTPAGSSGGTSASGSSE